MAVTAYRKSTEPQTAPISPLGTPRGPKYIEGIPELDNQPIAKPTLGPNFAFSTPGKPELPRNLIDTVNTAATNANIPPEVLASVPAQETGGYGYKAMTGTSGEKGITQIIPEYYFKEAGYKSAEEYGEALMSNNDFAIKETARILKKNYTSRKSIIDALREYNAGPRLVGGTQYAIDVLRRVGLEDEIPEEYRKSSKTK
jgi:hypothetical protein